jgi:hypothetical protein
MNKIRYNCIPYIQDNKNIKIIRDGKIIIVGGYYDGKILVVQNDSENISYPIYPFREESSIVTAINTDLEEKILFIGNNIGNISVFYINTIITEWKEAYFINDQLSPISSIETNYQLNVWASSTIDGFINIYTLPKSKLTKSFKIESNNLYNNIFICDSPLPSILFICQEDVFLYSINGNKIYYQKEYSKIINPIIIKDFIKNDFLAYIINRKEIYIRNVSDFTLISRIEIDCEILYLFPNDNCRVLYATNQNGAEINAVFLN